MGTRGMIGHFSAAFTERWIRDHRGAACTSGNGGARETHRRSRHFRPNAAAPKATLRRKAVYLPVIQASARLMLPGLRHARGVLAEASTAPELFETLGCAACHQPQLPVPARRKFMELWRRSRESLLRWLETL